MSSIIWDRINKLFKDKDKQFEVVKLMLKYGLSVRDGYIYIGDIKIPFSSIADTINIDRRVVVSTVQTIEQDELLKMFFRDLRPAGPFLRYVSKMLGYTTLIIVPFEDKPGIIASISSILAERNINIVQVIAEEPHLTREQKLYIIVEGDVPGDVINKISKLDFVKNIIIG